MARAAIKRKYGYDFPASWSDLKIEFFCIQKGGSWKGKAGQDLGDGLLNHYLNARALIWPKRYCHRWTRLVYEQVLKNQITIVTGPASAQKTSGLSEIALIGYWAFPDETAILLSTTSVDKLKSGIFAEVSMLFKMGRELYPWLAGHVLDYKTAIFTDDIKEDEIRDQRKGIQGKPCYVGNKYVGQAVYAGTKQERMWWIADELQYMPATFMDCIPNMRSNTGTGGIGEAGLKICGSGNLNHDPESQLAVIAEPLEGWPSVEDNEKTSVWPIKLTRGVCVNLIGFDCPNYDFPETEPDHYPKLLGWEFRRTIIKDYGRNSPVAETQLWGRMKLGLAHSRVITRQLCRQHHAQETATWQSVRRTRIYAIDPAYGGGDRCIAGWGEFGPDKDGKLILRLNPPHIIKIDLKIGLKPEDIIAKAAKKEMEELSISPDHAFYDSFGKGTIGYAFSRQFGHDCPVPVDASQKPTKRPVRDDLYVTDEGSGEKRLKRCDEHYSKFITEMWFSVRYIIEAEQMRELPDDVMHEGTWRQYKDVAGGKIEVEPKDEMKERTGKSPDLMDWCAVLCEGARQHGFKIGRLGDHPEESEGEDWFDIEVEKYEKIIKSKLIQHY